MGYLNKDEIITIRMTRKQALEQGLLTCSNCGHPENNHFEWGPCARSECTHVKCEQYKETARVGDLV